MSPAPVLTITSSAQAAILAAARAAAPEEACGILLGRAGHIAEAQATANHAPDPLRHFEIDPAALIGALRAERAGGAAVVGWFHSHPNGLARPSTTDAAMASRDGRVWAIAAAGAVSFWRDGAQGFEPLSTEVVDG